MPKRESPTYLPMGTERQMLVRYPRALKNELRHQLKRMGPQFGIKALGQFASLCLAVGMDHVRQAYLDPDATPAPVRGDLGQTRPLKTELRLLYRDVYRGLPSAGFGQFIAFCTATGMNVLRSTFVDKHP